MSRSADGVPATVLVVEDEADQRELIAGILRREGFEVRTAGSAEAALERIGEREPELVLCDWRLPGLSGGELLDDLRRAGRECAFIVMTAYGSIAHAVEAVRLGADDYLAKPFFVEELAARLHALARRVSGERQNVLAVGKLRLDRISREVTWLEQTVDLTGREFNLIEYLMRSPGRVFTRTQILEHVWGYDFDPQTNLVDVYIQRIRKKLAEGGTEPPIETVRGVGYRVPKPG